MSQQQHFSMFGGRGSVGGTGGVGSGSGRVIVVVVSGRTVGAPAGQPTSAHMQISPAPRREQLTAGMEGSQQQHSPSSSGGVVTGGRGVGTAASERQTVVASAGQATSAQKHSEALIDVLQEMAFCRISQQQQASGLVGAARVSELDRARKRFVRRIARFLFLMKRRKKKRCYRWKMEILPVQCH